MTRKYRPIPVEDILARLSPERQARIEARAAELIAAEIALGSPLQVEELSPQQVTEGPTLVPPAKKG
jgi:hypothetical protein